MPKKDETKNSTPSTPKKEKEETKPKKEEAETPKADVKKEKKAAKPKTEKKEKKAEKKSSTPKKTTTKKVTKKTTTTKKIIKKKSTTTKKEKTTEKKEKKEKKENTTESKSKSGLTKYEQYVVEAIQAKSNEDKQWVGFTAISGYIKQYIPDIKLGNCSTLARNAADRLVASGFLKAKRDSYAITKKGRSLTKEAPPKRKEVRPPVEKGSKRYDIIEQTELYLVPTSKGRASKQIIYKE